MLSAALLASGNNFQKIALFAKFLKLPILSSSSFIKIQRTYVTPSIEEIWTNHQNVIFEEFRGKDTVVLEKDYSEIKHSFDIWHGFKNLGEKIIKAG